MFLSTSTPLIAQRVNMKNNRQPTEKLVRMSWGVRFSLWYVLSLAVVFRSWSFFWRLQHCYFIIPHLFVREYCKYFIYFMAVDTTGRMTLKLHKTIWVQMRKLQDYPTDLMWAHSRATMLYVCECMAFSLQKPIPHFRENNGRPIRYMIAVKSYHGNQVTFISHNMCFGMRPT